MFDNAGKESVSAPYSMVISDMWASYLHTGMMTGMKYIQQTEVIKTSFSGWLSL